MTNPDQIEGRKVRPLDAFHAQLQQRCNESNTILTERSLYYDGPGDRVWYEQHQNYQIGQCIVRAYLWHGYPYISFDPIA